MSSSFIYKKIPYEGSLLKVKELVKNHNWNIEMKVSEEGILLFKIPKSIEEEISWYDREDIDEETNTKFGKFISITESDFEEGKNIESDIINKEEEEKEKEKKSEQNKKNKNIEYKRQISDILFNEETPEKKQSFFDIIGLKNKIEGIIKKVKEEYKDPYDFFFSPNYLLMCFIFAVICMIIFNF